MKPSASRGKTSPRAATAAVRFELPFLEAQEVFLAGSFNAWHPAMFPMIETPGGWTKDLVLPPGTYEYRFVVDGRWVADPNNPRSAPNPFGSVNSVVVVPPKPPVARTKRGAEARVP